MNLHNNTNKFSQIMNKIYQIIILNLITLTTIILGLGIFSFVPAIVSLIAMLKHTDESSIKGMTYYYFKTFFHIYKKGILINITFILLLFLGAFNIFYFYSWLQENEAIFFIIGYYATLFIELILILSTINACMMMEYYPHLKYIKIIKYAFKTLTVTIVKQFILLIILLCIWIIGSILIVVLPFFGISLFFYVAYRLVDPTYMKLVPEGYQTLNPYQL